MRFELSFAVLLSAIVTAQNTTVPSLVAPPVLPSQASVIASSVILLPTVTNSAVIQSSTQSAAASTNAVAPTASKPIGTSAATSSSTASPTDIIAPQAQAAPSPAIPQSAIIAICLIAAAIIIAVVIVYIFRKSVVTPSKDFRTRLNPSSSKNESSPFSGPKPLNTYAPTQMSNPGFVEYESSNVASAEYESSIGGGYYQQQEPYVQYSDAGYGPRNDVYRTTGGEQYYNSQYAPYSTPERALPEVPHGKLYYV